MPRSANRSIATLAALVFGGMICPQIPAADASGTPLELKKLAAPGKVAAVFWNARGDSPSLQVVFPANGTRVPGGTARARIQVWLLKQDGTNIQPTRQSPEAPATGPASAAPGSETRYSFPASAGTDAVAVVLKIDDTYYIDGLAPAAEVKQP